MYFNAHSFLNVVWKKKNHKLKDEQFFSIKLQFQKANSHWGKQGDKCLFELSTSIVLFVFKLIHANISLLGSKELIAANIVIHYRPIPKIKHKNKHEDIKINETNLKMVLFTNMM